MDYPKFETGEQAARFGVQHGNKFDFYRDSALIQKPLLQVIIRPIFLIRTILSGTFTEKPDCGKTI